MDDEIKQSKRGGARPGSGRKKGVRMPRLGAIRPSQAAHLAPYHFKPGEVHNPAGRPKGSRHKLGEAFLADFHADWLEHGRAAIVEVRETRPQDYLKAAVAILPRELKVSVGEYEDLSEDELDRRIRALGDAISAKIRVGEGVGREEAPHGTQQAIIVPTVQ